MPIYEYVCDETGDRLEAIRPIADADKPLVDPEGKGRVFHRVVSAFAARGQSGSPGSAPSSGGGCCPCGKNSGGCRSR